MLSKVGFVKRKLIEVEIGRWKSLQKLESKIGMANHACSTYVSQPTITAATSDLGIWLNGKIGLYL
jgi:hypothetical protein